MSSWLGNADQCMLKIRPSPGSQSTLRTPLLIFQSLELLVSMEIGDVWAAAEIDARSASPAAAAKNNFMGRPPEQVREMEDRACRLARDGMSRTISNARGKCQMAN